MGNLNFQQLKFAVAVADTGSFTQAADRCCVTQPALSNAIARLEDELGARLFDRTSRGVAPTEPGAQLIAEMRVVLSARRRLIERAAGLTRRDARTVRVGVSPIVDTALIAERLARLRAQTPPIEALLTEMNKADLQAALSGGVIDVAIGPAALADAETAATELYSEPLTAVLEDGGAETPLALDAVASRSFLLVQDACGLAGAVRALFEQYDLPLIEYQGRALGYHILEDWARMGLGVAVLPQSKLSARGGRPLLDPAGRPARIRIEAAWRRAAPPSKAATALLDALRAPQ